MGEGESSEEGRKKMGHIGKSRIMYCGSLNLAH